MNAMWWGLLEAERESIEANRRLLRQDTIRWQFIDDELVIILDDEEEPA